MNNLDMSTSKILL